jgi:hypothetical protein
MPVVLDRLKAIIGTPAMLQRTFDWACDGAGA